MKDLSSIFLSSLLLISSPWLAISRNTIKYLPGFQGPLPFKLETGYISVSDYGQLFYYFVESENNPKEDPLLLWLTGGPGCSVLSGLLYEIGPMNVVNMEYKRSLPILFLNPNSWTKVSNIVFLDQPVGTGFSYSTVPVDYANGDTQSAKDAHEFLKKWLIDHPQFLSNPLYIGGDSYAGKVVPIVAQEIANGIEQRQKPLLNLQGYLAGNPRVDEDNDESYAVPFAHGMGLISNELYELAERSCHGLFVNPINEQCAKDLDAIHKSLSGINTAHILEPLCPFASPNPKETPRYRRYLEEKSTGVLLPELLPKFGCRNYHHLLSTYWANDNSVREALHVRKGSIAVWRRCYLDIPYSKDIRSSTSYHLNLTGKGYRALVYSGDHDMLMSFVGTQAWIRSLNFSILDSWRSWSVDGQVAGYTVAYSNNFTFATVKGGGHTAPEYKQKECFAMFQRWISRNPL